MNHYHETLLSGAVAIIATPLCLTYEDSKLERYAREDQVPVPAS